MEETKTNFIRQIIESDLASGKHSKIATRFPPEPNGYLHIGHAKSIVLNFSIAEDYEGICNLRFDDTNPQKEEEEFVEAIKKDVEWLGYHWDNLYFASDYFEQLYGYAVELIENGLAYVCELTPEEMRAYRGTLTEPGKESPYRNRSVEENLDLFHRMRDGEFPDGSRVLRAKIDMASPNMNMRDPVLYRIRSGLIHHQTGDAWCLYPMYDFTHPISDAIEGITHSLCTLEFEDHRPLYDWVLDNISIGCHPRQIEFARLNLNYTMMSKRKLLQLVEEGFVHGWDDPRMATLSGLRRRGYTPESIRAFAERVGVAKRDSVVDVALLEHCVRNELNRTAQRRMAVLDPVKVVITNFPVGQTDELEAVNNPEDENAGKRKVPFSREVYIEQEDFREDPPKKWFRLAPGAPVAPDLGVELREEVHDRVEVPQRLAVHVGVGEQRFLFVENVIRRKVPCEQQSREHQRPMTHPQERQDRVLHRGETCADIAEEQPVGGPRRTGVGLRDIDKGIGTHLAIEDGLVGPGTTFVSTDSHANIMGAVGAFGQGMGDQDIAAAWAHGKVWFKVPPSVRIVLTGKPSAAASAKVAGSESRRRRSRSGADAGQSALAAASGAASSDAASASTSVAASTPASASASVATCPARLTTRSSTATSMPV